MQYIATFFSHFGAVRFIRELRARGLSGRAMPVPRDLSSSCGTCVLYQAEDWLPEDTHGEIEQIVVVTSAGYRCIYRAEHS